MNEIAQTHVAYAQAQWGEWIAKCPRPGCTNAMAFERGQETFICAGRHSCGMQAPIQWPPDPVAIEAILMLRPLPGARNWLPGETLTDLVQENIEHGDMVPGLDVAALTGDVQLLHEVDGIAVGGLLLDLLPALADRRRVEVEA